ncbi:MAG: hypothetical protein ACLPHP_20160 [Candidatus Sulfotelmatobacter sp.]
MIRPIELEQPDQAWHFNLGKLKGEAKVKAESLTEEIVALLHSLRVVS